jgi:hypothetical protein
MCFSEIAYSRSAQIFLDFALPVIKEASAGQCPVIGWFTAPLSHALELMGPEHLGGHGDLGAKITAAAAQNGKTPMEVADSVSVFPGNPGHPAHIGFSTGVQVIRRQIGPGSRTTYHV